ncbi:L-ornithine transporter [Roridomyces roridus]|uniref:L-ornithine transporter n=1 Tax=Roridomyces roridus TaxID=1738132 RepID=A0AAD7C2J0_9AGAR|nr:L-ornithine transporter [Roridomyces roridus]
MVSEVIEYPADLAKTRLQAQLLTPAVDESRIFKGPMDTLKQTWKNEGFRGLYRGLPAPLAGSMVETAALFLSYSYFQNLIRKYTGTQQLTIPQLGLAAAGAGFASSFILTPIELVKCKMQVQLMNSSTTARVPPIHALPKSAATLRAPLPPASLFERILGYHPASPHDRASGRPPGIFAIVRSTIETHGVRGLWLGQTGTLLRETGGTASWFAVKEWVASELLDHRLGPQRSPTNTTLLPWESAVSGAISGAACVLALYPADTVKSAIQTEEELLSHRPVSVSSVAKSGPPSFFGTLTKMYATHGIRGLYAGCGMTVLRAVPSSGVVFVVVDGLGAWIG